MGGGEEKKLGLEIECGGNEIDIYQTLCIGSGRRND